MPSTRALHAIACVAALVLGMPAFAQFDLPPGPRSDEPALTPPTPRMDYQYSYGNESPFTYRRDNDLDRNLRDNSLLFKTKVFGTIVWRPTDWLTTLLEMKLGGEWPIFEEEMVRLPSGDIKFPPERKATLLVEQALITVRRVIAPFELNVGRRNYEDERHFLYDGSIDVASLSFKHEDWRAEAFVARDVLWGLDFIQHAKTVPVQTTMLHVIYQGFENQVLGGYAMRRRDLSGHEGEPIWIGFHASGKPTDTFSYWSHVATMRGHDEAGRKFRANAIDLGGTYRFANVPFDPNLTLAYARGSGDGNSDDGTNNEFRQTGLQTNEARYIGLAKFKVFGEMLDSELSNLKIATVGAGARLRPGISLDLVYHKYRLDQIAHEIRNWALTAQMNTLPDRQSKDLGQSVEVIAGFRGMFGLPRLGLDLRAGKFFPGKAFETSNGSGGIRGANSGISVVAKFRW